MNYPHPHISSEQSELVLQLTGNCPADESPMRATATAYAELLKAELLANPTKKQIVVVRYIPIMDMLKDSLAEFGAVVLRAVTRPEELAKALQDFESIPERRVLLITELASTSGFRVSYPADTDILTPTLRPSLVQTIFRVRPLEPSDLTVRLMYYTDTEWLTVGRAISNLRNSAHLIQQPFRQVPGRQTRLEERVQP